MLGIHNSGGRRFLRVARSLDMFAARVRLRVAGYPLVIDHTVSRVAESGLDAWWRTSAARREGFQVVLAILFGTVLAWATAEAFLRLPVRLPYELETKLYSCYDEYDVHQAVYFLEPRLKVYVFKPGYETSCRWNHYRWRHRGDRWGFRNPESWDRADIVLLGDSMTYGHGIQEKQTIAHFLREKSGRRVANLGITGGSPVEYVAYVRNFALRLRPKVVTVIMFANDFEDIGQKRTIAEEDAFVAGEHAPELGVYDPFSLVQAGPDMHEWTLDRVKRWTLTYQAWLFYEPRLREFMQDPRAAWVRWQEEESFDDLAALEARRAARPVADPRPIDPDRVDMAAPPHAVAYTRKAFSIMAASTREAGAELVLAFLPELDRRDQTRDSVVEGLCGEIAAGEGLPFLDLRPIVSAPNRRAFPGDRLPVDGHLTEQGSRRVAGAIDAFLREKGLLGSPRAPSARPAP